MQHFIILLNLIIATILESYIFNYYFQRWLKSLIFRKKIEPKTKLRELEQLKRICVIFVKLRKVISSSV